MNLIPFLVCLSCCVAVLVAGVATPAEDVSSSLLSKILSLTSSSGNPSAGSLSPALRDALSSAASASSGTEGFRILTDALLLSRIDKLRGKISAGGFKESTRTTPYGSVTGYDDGKVEQYLGIPFAQPPVGPLRWKAPVEVSPWGSLNATWWGKTCIQSGNTWSILTGQDEDCLYANVSNGWG